MPRFIYWKYNKEGYTPTYVPMDDSGLLEIAREMLADGRVRAIIARVGLHGDLTEAEEEEVDTAVIEGAERRRWQDPHPANLYIPIALARQFAEAAIDPADTRSALAFIADRRCDGVVIGKPSTCKPNRLSELLPIMRALDEQEDITAPFKALRQKTFRHGQRFFEDEDQAKAYYSRASHFVNQQRFKYALLNRSHHGFNQVVTLLELYAVRKIDRLDDEEAIAYVLSGNKSNNPMFHVIDDR